MSKSEYKQFMIAPAFVVITLCLGVFSSPASAACDNLTRLAPQISQDYPYIINDARSVDASMDLPAYCKIAGMIAPQIGFEVRLPIDSWNGKFLMQGCGGLCGIINMEAADDALARGYAVANTDMGHKGQPFSGIWAFNNRSAEIDFGYRATHATARVAKALIKTYYESDPRYSYFRGCSTGGRQGMVEAQRYPDDFDGIISGAPVLNETGDGMLHLLWTIRANLDQAGQSILDGNKLGFIRDAMLETCDHLDGTKDGLLDDPRTCPLEPKDLLCANDETNSQCLSHAEAFVLEKIYGGAKDSQGTSLFPGGLAKGSEYEWSPALIGKNSEPPLALTMPMLQDMVRYMIYTQDQPNADMMDFDFDRDPARMADMERIYTASNPDLSAYKARGGKIIMYHGWDDIEVPPFLSIDYYERVETFMEGRENIDDFYRLFMMPGVAHCRRGPGPDAVDYLSALENWVENGIAPDTLEAAHLVTPQTYNGLPRLRYPLAPEAYDYTRLIAPYHSSTQ